jgi:probable rRNA maturation factor
LLTCSGLQDKDLSILFVDNEKITEMNDRFFARKRPTNVISFSYLDGFNYEIMGDIIISVEQAGIEAERLGVPFYERLFSLIIHGLLHILGFDHEIGAREARRMRYREKKLLNYVITHSTYKKLAL